MYKRLDFIKDENLSGEPLLHGPMNVAWPHERGPMWCIEYVYVNLIQWNPWNPDMSPVSAS